jgi:hypothetical protein
VKLLPKETNKRWVLETAARFPNRFPTVSNVAFADPQFAKKGFPLDRSKAWQRRAEDEVVTIEPLVPRVLEHEWDYQAASEHEQPTQGAEKADTATLQPAKSRQREARQKKRNHGRSNAPLCER